MDTNLLNSSLPRLNLTPFTAQYTLAQTSGSTLTIQITPSVEIGPGFRVSSVNELSLGVSIDQHTLRFYIEEEYSVNGTIEYVLKAVGMLFYNILLSGLEAIEPVLGSTGDAGFNTSGEYNVNHAIGVFNSIDEIQRVTTRNFIINATINEIFIVRPNGEIVIYDPSNPQPFFDALSEDNYKTLHSRVTVQVSFTDEPIS